MNTGYYLCRYSTITLAEDWLEVSSARANDTGGKQVEK